MNLSLKYLQSVGVFVMVDCTHIQHPIVELSILCQIHCNFLPSKFI